VLATIRSLLDQLEAGGVRYCHWKSNWALARTLDGETDIDILIHRGDALRFQAILENLGFRAAIDTSSAPVAAIEHHFAMDAETGTLVHVHAYYRVITGESLSKNYRLPVEGMLLEGSRREGSVRVPSKGAELIIFTVRMLLKHTSPMELFMLSRYWEQVRPEIDWLLEGDPVDEALALLPRWLPPVDPETFLAGFRALEAPAPLWKRIALAYRLRGCLRSYARHGWLRARITELSKFLGLAIQRLKGSKKGLTPWTGGAVIAFVGSEATGKSTLISELGRWLGEHYAVDRIHAGKPPGTALSAVPNTFLPALRALLPGHRSTHVEIQYTDPEAPAPADDRVSLLFAVRSFLLGWDRRALLLRAHARAANGKIVLCDRYPASSEAAPDGPQLAHLPMPSEPLPLRRWLAQREQAAYRSIPPPDLVVYLTAPLDVTLARNAARDKFEPEDYVRRRHARSSSLEFEGAPVHRVDTDREFEDTLREVREAVWRAL
jgi:thymidylate kinase